VGSLDPANKPRDVANEGKSILRPQQITADPVTRSKNFLVINVAMIIVLTLLVNVSFKMIAFQGMVFAASSLLCPLYAGLYLVILKHCDVKQQRHVLNLSLLALYVFSIGIYLLLNLPPADDVRVNLAYQIVFEDVPKKFFASTLAFAVSFYLPHMYCLTKNKTILTSAKKRLLLALGGGFVFFSIDFLLLFSDPQVENFTQIYLDSVMITSLMLLLIGLIYLVSMQSIRSWVQVENTTYGSNPLYQYLVGFIVVVLMICLACEYRLVAFSDNVVLVASSILSPMTLMASNLIGELYGYQANKRMVLILLFSELMFDFILMTTVLLPSPDFFNLNSFYQFVLPRRIPAATLAILLAFGGNAWLLEKLKKTLIQRSLRFVVANTIANTLLCFVTYSLLFVGVYPGEKIVALGLSAWIFKVSLGLITIPFVLWIFKSLAARNASVPLTC
jgi:uncharacterized PurR-regulated membrane protein YhhQ (DUF165 family)